MKLLVRKNLNNHRKMSAVESRLYKIMKKRVEPFGFFQGSYSVGHMRLSKIVDFQLALIKKLKSIICSSEGYLEPGRITMMKVLAVKFCKKALS